MNVLLAVALAIGAAGPAGADPTALLSRMDAAYARVASYTARFVRQERVGGRLREREEARLKYQRPGRIYLHWISGPSKGREILYVAGQNDDKLLVHEPGLLLRLFTYVVAPDSPRILAESRHPLTDIGIGRLAERIQGDLARGLREGELVVIDRGQIVDGDGRVRRVDMALTPGARGQYYAPRVVVDVDEPSGLPIGLTVFDREGQLLGQYEYRDVRLNVPLGDADFDPANPEYRFPRRRLAVQ